MIKGIPPFSHERMNKAWDLSNEAYPRLMAEQRENEWRLKRLKIRDTLCYQLCKALRS